MDPSFEGDQAPKNNLQKVVSSFSTSDISKLHAMPCFRSAILTGGAVGGVVLAVLITTRSAVPRALNWGMAGFLIGSTVSWEQCRFKVRQEKKEQRMAREMYKKQGGNVPGVDGPSKTAAGGVS